MRREDQRFGKWTDTRPGPRPPEPRRWTKQQTFNLSVSPGEVWEVHASRNEAPPTVHYVLIGMVPEEWVKKYNFCARVPRMRSQLRFATPGISEDKIIEENLSYLRNAPLLEKNWTINLKYDFVAGYMTFARAVGFAEWRDINNRDDADMLVRQPVPDHGLTVDLAVQDTGEGND